MNATVIVKFEEKLSKYESTCLVFAQFVFKFHKNGDNRKQKLSDLSDCERMLLYSILNNERNRAF